MFTPRRPLSAAALALAAALAVGTAAPAGAAPAPAAAPAAATTTAAAPASPLPAAAKCSSSGSSSRHITLYKRTKTNVHLRTSASAKSRSQTILKKGRIVRQTASKGSWVKVAVGTRTGWVISSALRYDPGLYATSDSYVTTQNGSTSAWFTKGTTTVSVGGCVGSFTVAKGTPAWKVKDLGKGKWRVNIGGFHHVTVTASRLQRSNPLYQSNHSKISSASFRKLKAGYIADKYLAETNFGTHAAIGAPAAAKLDALNVAFRKRFGESLYLDIGYRTRSQQVALFKALPSTQVAVPGASMHEKGLAFDTPDIAGYDFGSARYTWLVKNAPRYGWAHPSRLNKYTSSGKLNPYREAWHFEYQR